MASCNSGGGIYCKDASGGVYCASPGTWTICYVEGTGEQLVKLYQTTGTFDLQGNIVTPPILSSWNFDKLIFTGLSGVHFVNINSKIADGHTIHSTENDGQQMDFWQNDGINNDIYAIKLGGNGTCGGYEVNQWPDTNAWGGAGGQGGNGGKVLVGGGAGIQGGFGRNSGTGANGADMTYPGANVQIKANTIQFAISYIGDSLSVNGINGANGSDSDARGFGTHNGAGGGGGGAGGAGGGWITIISNDIKGSGTIAADGGAGGAGGKGNNGYYHADGGGGAGGSGGQSGKIIIYSANTIPSTITFSEKGGAGGAGGPSNDNPTGIITTKCDRKSGNNFVGRPGNPGDANTVTILPIIILNETGLDPVASCTDGIDNDMDGFVDFEDKDCWNSDSVKAFHDIGVDIAGPINFGSFNTNVNGFHSILSQSWWNPKSVTASSGVCGLSTPTTIDLVTSFEDDIGTCDRDGWTCHLKYPPGDTQCIFSNVAHLGKCSIQLNSMNDYMHFYSSQGLAVTNSIWVYVVGQGTVSVDSYSVTAPVSHVTSNNHNVWELLTISGAGANELVITYDGVSKAYIDDVFAGPWVFNNGNEENGYITQNNSIPSRTQFMCYDNTANNIKNYNWLDAMRVKYQIKTVGTSKGEVDTISNSKDWYYCNATGDGTLKGKQISEGSTFAPASGNNQVSCYDLVSSYFSAYYSGKYIFADGCPISPNILPSGMTACCDGMTNLNAVISNCNCKYLGADNRLHRLILPDTYDVPSTLGASGGQTILKELCLFDTLSCLSDKTFNFDSKKTCEFNARSNDFNVSSNINVPCDLDNNVCIGGVVVNTSDSNSTANKLCCFGQSAKCTPIGDVDTSTSEACILENGKPFDVSSDYVCSGSSSIPIENAPGQACCFGTLSIPLQKHFFQSQSNTSFMCFKQGDINLLSQCCYDSSCKNIIYNPGEAGLDFFKNRVTTLGSVQNTIVNFDELDENGGKILDYVRKFTFDFQDSPIGIDGSYTGYRIINLSTFTYLEFDIAYSSQGINVSLNDVNLGLLSDYSNNGNESNRWHHIVIPLKSFIDNNPNNVLFSSLQFTAPEDFPQGNLGFKVKLILDNVLLSSDGNDLNTNSKNRYCTGGFEGWIDDLDPPDSAYDVSSTFFNSWSNYGPYMLTCNSIGPYSWTGRYCCGDDTKLNNYGEYYNDTMFGCFGGTKLMNDWTVSYAKNMQYDSSYKYKDLLYYNDTFVGCQIPLGKYYDLNVGYGESTQVALVNANNIITSQCMVVGHHYCMNNAWKEDFDIGNFNHLALTDQKVLLKTAPAGPNLIKKGFSPNLLGGTS